MNTAGITAAINVIADSLYSLATLVLEDDEISENIKVVRNTLKDSQMRHDLYVAQVSTMQDVVIEALFNNYVVFIEWDRPAKHGKRPPIDALKEWAEKNGIPTDASTLWAISTAIWRDGHKGRPIFATIDKESDILYQTEWADKLFSSITSDLDNIFND